MPADPRKTILMLTPTFVPDPASVGQHMADAAFELARRGNQVRVFTARNGYDDPKLVYPKHEILNGVDVRRMPYSSFGKATITKRLFGTFAFMTQCIVHGLFTRRIAGMLITTSPPLSDLAGAILATIRRIPVVYWGMDLYAAQVLALGKLKKGGLKEKLLILSQRFILSRCVKVIALDRFMAERLKTWGVPDEKLVIMPPWPHENHLAADPGENPFRVRHGLVGKFVVMYSGSHAMSNPLRTLLDATLKFKNDDSIRFLFVGGGVGKKEVEEHIKQHDLKNVMSLPYQPLSELKYSLTSADVHVVSLGSGMVGIIHPCKIYGAMAAARPVLAFGPKPSHIADLLENHNFGFHVSHGDVAGAEKAIEDFRALPQSERESMGAAAQQLLQSTLSQQILCGKFCDIVEQAFGIKH